MTLCQYYDSHVKQMGFRSWNHFCAEYQIPAIEHLKKQLKKQYKEIYRKDSK